MKRGKNKQIDGKLIDFNNFDAEKFQEFLKFQAFYDVLKTEENLSAKQLIEKIESEVLIPSTIFTSDLGTLETVCKYLKEDLRLKNSQISKLISRDSKSVWQAYSKSRQKHPNKLNITRTKYYIPASIFSNHKNSILENLVMYLKDKFALTYHEIAVMLHRDDRTIWTVYNKGIKRNE